MVIAPGTGRARDLRSVMIMVDDASEAVEQFRQLRDDDEGGSAYPGGFLYIPTNVGMNGVVKIGQTQRSPHARAFELSSHSGVPLPFEVYCYFEVSDRLAAEKQSHNVLNHLRVSSSREFFRIEPNEAAQILECVLTNLITGKMQPIGLAPLQQDPVPPLQLSDVPDRATSERARYLIASPPNSPSGQN